MRWGMPPARDGIDVEVAIVFAAEGDGFAVGGEDGVGFQARAGGEADGGAARRGTRQRSLAPEKTISEAPRAGRWGRIWAEATATAASARRRRMVKL